MTLFGYISGVIVLLLVIGAGYFYTAKQTEAPTLADATKEEMPADTSANQSISETENTTAPGATDSSGANAGSTSQPTQTDAEISEAPKTVTVAYSKNGYSPANIEIKVGDKVRWVSDGAPMWTASAIHPTHQIYPEFDQDTVGDIYEFTFTKVGTWRYHNHVSANHSGSVVVK